MMMVNGSRYFVIIWIPDQVAIVKKLMVEGRVEERELTPNYAN
jgi:Tfp pilus assembly PilM family ATPase